MKKRIFSLILAVIMLISVLPVSALAAETASEEPKVESSESEVRSSVEVPENDVAEEPETAAESCEAEDEEIKEKSEESLEPEEEDEEPAEELQDFALSEQAGNVIVTLEAEAGAFGELKAEEAKLSVKKIEDYEAVAGEIEEAVSENREEDANLVSSYKFDISVFDKDGNEVQPVDGAVVRVSFALAEVVDREQNLTLSVYHVKEEESALKAEELVAEEAIAAEERGDETVVTVETDGFSFYVIEFTYQSLKYDLWNTSIPLSIVLKALNLTGNVETAVSGDTSVVSVEQAGDDWIIKVLDHFTSPITLTVKIGSTDYTITLTDKSKDAMYLVFPQDDPTSHDVSITGKDGIVTVYCLQHNFYWPDGNVHYFEQSGVNPNEFDYEDLLSEEEVKILRRLVWAGYPNDALGIIRTLNEMFGGYYDFGPYITQEAIWTLMAMWKKAGSDSSDLRYLDPTYDYYEDIDSVAVRELIEFATNGPSIDPPTSPTIVVEGSGKLNKGKDGLWSTGNLQITQPDDYNLPFTLTPPEGVWAVNEFGETITSVSEFETFRLVTDDPEAAEEKTITANAVASYPTDVTFLLTNDKLDGRDYQTMLYVQKESMALSGSLKLTVEELGSLSVTKTVDGKGADKSRAFNFTVKLSYGTITGTHGDMTFTNGVATFSLKDGETKVASDLPAGITYEVTEDDYSAAGYETTKSGDSGEIISGQVKHASFVNTMTATVTVSGSKTWDDANNKDGKRPESIHIHLHADGVHIGDAHPTAADGWKWSFTDLPKYDSGREIVYTIKEDSVDEYITEYNGYNVTNKYTPGETSLSVYKVWDDDNNRDGKRPESVTVRLLADGADTGNSLTLNESNNWSGIFEELDEYKDQKKIEYTVEEETVAEYSTAISGDAVKGYTVTNSHISAKVSVEGSKVWDDDNNRDGKRPESVTVRLFATVGSEAKQEIAHKTVSAAEDWQFLFTDLPKYNNGKEIKYTVDEDAVAGYEKALSGSAADGFVITNSYTPETVTVAGVKTWDDANNKDGNRPNKIHIHLHADGVHIGDAYPSAVNGWKWSFTNLPKYENGNLIVYTIKEDSVVDYITEYSGYNVTNKYTPGKTSLSVYKIWDDDNNRDGLRPAAITVRLLADGVATDKSLTLNENNSWSDTFEELDEYKDGEKIVYTVVEETEVEGYTCDKDGNATKGYTLTNTHKTAKVSINVNKTWNDANNQDGKRPGSITVRLYADGTEIAHKVASAEGGWNCSFTDLPKYNNGKAVTYEISEDAVSGYTTAITGKAETGFVITNSYTPETVTVAGVKTWDDANNQDGKRPASIHIHLHADNVHIKDAYPTAADGWKWSFTNLPKYKDGNLIVYTIKEDSVAEYITEYSGYNVTNSYKPGETSLSVYKIWDDDNNRDGLRPAEITVKLLADGADTGKSLTLNESNSWTDTFKELDEYKAGKKIVYTVAETAVSGYTCVKTGNAELGYTLTNRHTPETITVEGSKTWRYGDSNVESSPESIHIHLHADGKHIDGKDVTAADGWRWRFTGLHKYEGGREIVYTIKEDSIDDFITEYDGYNVINTYKPGKTSLSVYKVWDDDNNRDGLRPAEVTVRLFIEGAATEKSLTLNKDNNWSGTFKELDENYDYTIKEDPVDGYTIQLSGDAKIGYTLTNKHTPLTTEISASKVWDDADNQDGKRPESVIFRLYADNTEVDYKTVSAADDWKCSFTELPKFKNGVKITYNVDEDLPAGYEKTVDGSEAAGYVITNKYTPETLSISGNKVWDDENNKYSKRPESIKIHLLADGSDIDSITVTAADEWKFSFDDLPVYKEGKKIVYSVTEDVPNGYMLSVKKNSENDYTLTNTYVCLGNLRIQKTVSGDLGDRRRLFTFTVTFDDNGTYSYSGSYSGIIRSGGSVLLRHGEYIIIEDLPAGIGYTVTESGNTGYTVTKRGDTGTIPVDATAIADFNNYRGHTPKTGDDHDPRAWALMMLGAMAGICGVAAVGRKKRKATND